MASGRRTDTARPNASFPFISRKTIRDKSSELLGEQDHSYHHEYCDPKQQFAQPPAPHCALLGAALLPKPDCNEDARKSQKPRTQSREKRACRSSSQCRCESNRQATTNRRERT